MKVTITGINGFIGSALNKRLLNMGWETTPVLSPDSDYVFLFGSPSSDYWFKNALEYSIRETVDNFLSVLEFCGRNGCKLIYPSSATVYSGETSYAKTKHILDTIATMYHNVLGLRIYAGYGPGEGHKGEYASVVYKFLKAMKTGDRPIIWGDGTQSRDFIYIDDIISAIIEYRDRSGFIDVGSGVSHTFNEVVDIINNHLGKKIEPIYTNKPAHYIGTTICKTPYHCKEDLDNGIEKMLYILL